MKEADPTDKQLDEFAHDLALAASEGNRYALTITYEWARANTRKKKVAILRRVLGEWAQIVGCVERMMEGLKSMLLEEVESPPLDKSAFE